MTNVVNLAGEPIIPPNPGEPNPGLVASLEALLDAARAGDLQCFVGTGFTGDGVRVSVFPGEDVNTDPVALLGAVTLLQHRLVCECEGGE